MKWRSKREVPLEVIEKGLKDGDCDVRMAAYKIAKNAPPDSTSSVRANRRKPIDGDGGRYAQTAKRTKPI